jgi:hypothetical protein
METNYAETHVVNDSVNDVSAVTHVFEGFVF